MAKSATEKTLAAAELLDFLKEALKQAGVDFNIMDILQAINYLEHKGLPQFIYDISHTGTRNTILKMAEAMHYCDDYGYVKTQKNDLTKHLAFQIKLLSFAAHLNKIEDLAELKTLFNLETYENNLKNLEKKLLSVNQSICQLTAYKEQLKQLFDTLTIKDLANLKFFYFILILDNDIKDIPSNISYYINDLDLERLKDAIDNVSYANIYQLTKKAKEEAIEIFNIFEEIKKINFLDIFSKVKDKLKNHQEEIFKKIDPQIFEKIADYIKSNAEELVFWLNKYFNDKTEQEYYLQDFLKWNDYLKTKNLMDQIHDSSNYKDIINSKSNLIEIFNENIFKIDKFIQLSVIEDIISNHHFTNDKEMVDLLA